MRGRVAAAPQHGVLHRLGRAIHLLRGITRVLLGTAALGAVLPLLLPVRTALLLSALRLAILLLATLLATVLLLAVLLLAALLLTVLLLPRIPLPAALFPLPAARFPRLPHRFFGRVDVLLRFPRARGAGVGFVLLEPILQLL